MSVCDTPSRVRQRVLSPTGSVPLSYPERAPAHQPLDDDVIDKGAWWCPVGRWKSVNHNVMLMYIVTLVVGIADSIWNGTIMVAFIYLLSHKSNTVVGVIEASNGVVALMVALPVGYFADKVGRAAAMRVGAFGMVISTAFTCWLTIYAEENQDEQHWLKWVFLAALSLWGMSESVIYGPGQALFADSLPRLNRTQPYTILQVMYLVGAAVGPGIAVVWFYTHENEWTLRELRNLILIGQGMEIGAAVLLCCFTDRKALEVHEDEAVTGHEVEQALQGGKSWITREQVPFVLLTVDFVTAVGSGMTVKFFPLFWKEDVGLSPASVQLIYFVAPLGIAVLSTVAQRSSKLLGRPLACFVMRVVSVSFLVALVVLRHTLPAVPLCAIYIIRTSLANASYPLEESILMDFVPRESRARWKGLQEIAVFGWCGSAALGGWIGDHYGYAHTFIITAIVQFAGVVPMLLLVPVVPAEGPKPSDAAPSDKAANDVESDAPSVDAPLLVGPGSAGIQ
eukprot:TRINITY_DN4439_c0_g1_i1.p1 TRINITY_DN4439_c0_g1~~TRINITY_DN4439_c0_g1_i1.p1  ORF type:complete len:509 (+),score=106.36 TRINITY_DN4439_c0_g1_i1:59-1585(+)